MRQLWQTVVVMLVAAWSAAPARADKVEVKGVHLCCPSCVKSVQGILSKVEGVTDVACDRNAHTVTFSSADHKTAESAFHALLKGGFYGQASDGGKALKTKNPGSKDKVDKVTVTQVHVCCNSCRKAIQSLFKDATITYAGSGAQRDVTIAGTNLDAATVMDTLRKAGFNGSPK